MNTSQSGWNPSRERDRIVQFLLEEVGPSRSVVIGISGGIDSDVVARLSVAALGSQRIRAFTVTHESADNRHIENARLLSGELGLDLREIDFSRLPEDLVERLSAVEGEGIFSSNDLLDIGKAQNSLRTCVLSMYAERGFLVVGTSNLTEVETGFFLPFGDGLAHIQPIAHVRKSEVRELARVLGTSERVLEQDPSAGYWHGETDLEDLAFWLAHGAPLWRTADFDHSRAAFARSIAAVLTFEKLDKALRGLAQGLADRAVAAESGLHAEIVNRLRTLIGSAKMVKRRPVGRCLPRVEYGS